jgi:hypothetical protein
MLWNQKVLCRIHNSPSPVPVLTHINQAPSFPSHFLKIHFNIIILSMPRSSSLSFPLRYPYRNHVCTSPVPHTWHIQHKLLPQLTIQNPIMKFSFKTLGKICRRNVSSHTELNLYSDHEPNLWTSFEENAPVSVRSGMRTFWTKPTNYSLQLWR